MPYTPDICAVKTRQLQEQFICPIWAVWFGKSVKLFLTAHHAAQFLRALRLNATPCAGFDGRGLSL